MGNGRRRARRGLVAGTIVLIAAAVLPAAAPALVVGLGDQKPGVFSDQRLRGLGLRTARLTVSWDVATRDPQAVRTWLGAVRAAGLEPQIAFEHLPNERCPASPCRAPSTAEYRSAAARFRALFPEVTTLTTWNESNHQSQPVSADPEAVASYYGVLRGLCQKCTIVGADVLDSGRYVRWLERFRAAAPEARLYGLHNYGDVTYGTTAGVDAVLAAVPGTLWIEETGGIVTLRNEAGRITLSTNEARAGAAIERAFTSALARPRVTRLSVYQWTAPSGSRFDAGLIRADGSERPSYAALRRGLASLPAWSGPVTIWTARLQRPNRRRLLLTASCDEACSGRVTVTIRGRRVATRRYATGSSQVLRIAIPRSIRGQLLRSSQRRAVIRTDAGMRSVVTIRLR